MTIIINESGMDFPVEEDNTFIIEKSGSVLKRNIKSVEYVERRVWGGKKILRFLEAKSSNPNVTNKDDYDKYISEIRDKFQNSISIMFSSLAKRKGMDDVRNELPIGLKNLKVSDIDDCGLCLVVKESQPEWLVPVMDSLKKELKSIMKCWNIPDSNLKVINEDLARQQKIIS